MLIHRLRHPDLVNERGLRSQFPVINNSIDPKPFYSRFPAKFKEEGVEKGRNVYSHKTPLQ
jgi:hypothetical protein